MSQDGNASCFIGPSCSESTDKGSVVQSVGVFFATGDLERHGAHLTK